MMTVLLIDDNSLVPLITLAFVAVVITSEKITMVTTPCRITSGDHTQMYVTMLRNAKIPYPEY